MRAVGGGLLVAAVLSVVAPATSSAALPGQSAPGARSAAGLGPAVPLEPLGRSGDRIVRVGDVPFGWGVDAVIDGTVDLLDAGIDSRAWTGTAPKPGGIAVGRGWVHQRWSAPELLPVRSPAGSPDPTVIESNLDAGAATWTWTYRGVQYVNDHDHGRQVQAALFVDGPTGRANPTEAGDKWSHHALHPARRHGSPVARAVTIGSTQSTRAVPLDWISDAVDQAVLWRDVRLGKDLALDWGGRAGVTRYRTALSLPQATTGHLEMPTAYLRAAFRQLYGVDAATGTRTPLDPREGDAVGVDYAPRSGRGGIVAATRDGAHAFGIYGATTAVGGPVTNFSVHSFLPTFLLVDPVKTGQFDADTIKLRAERRHATFPAGESTYDTFVVTGTLDEVVAHMTWLASGGETAG